MKRTIIDVKWDKHHDLWVYGIRGDHSKDYFAQSKRSAVSYGRARAKLSQPSQLIIRGKNGRIQTEHTYPRASDPRRSKG